MSRCEALLQLEAQGLAVQRPSFKELLFGRNKTKLHDPLIGRDCQPDITQRRIDICEMINVLFGKTWKKIYLSGMILDTILSLASYSIVFSSSLASNLEIGFLDTCDIYKSEGFFSDCWKTYWFFLAIFTGVSIYLTLIEMHEQKVIQNVITGASLFNILIVLTLSIISLATNTAIDSSDSIDPGSYKAADIYNIGISLPIILFASIYQTSLPSIIEFVGEKTTSIKKILTYALFASLFIYLSMGLIVPAAVSGVYGQYNISFRNYSAGYSQAERPWWTYVIAYIIVLSPAVGILSLFPLVAIPLAHNLITYIYGFEKPVGVRLGDYIIKLIVVLLPLILAFIEYDLGSILSIAGAITIVLVSITIPIMHIASREMIDVPSHYDFKYSPRLVSIFVVVVHIGVLIFKAYYAIFPEE
mmetsp:Transcript_188/g.168  ORF Transcript_188/g.168 Transcript_188/m.168 type:complete len:416 (-) Transcript_188:45-1292(-)